VRNREARIARVADQLDALRAHRLSADSFRVQLPELFSSLGLDAVFANLHHYLDDEDIRVRDPEYRAMQEAELAKLISLLRSGASQTRLEEVTFLVRSRTPT
jgi:hypothetical protein